VKGSETSAGDVRREQHRRDVIESLITSISSRRGAVIDGQLTVTWYTRPVYACYISVPGHVHRSAILFYTAYRITSSNTQPNVHTTVRLLQLLYSHHSDVHCLSLSTVQLPTMTLLLRHSQIYSHI